MSLQKSLTNKISKVLNIGGYGCILSPALIFYDSKIVNEDNKSQYVTKIGSNIEEEYNFCEIALRILGPIAYDVGIFPVDGLHCGITLRDLGPNARSIIEKCNNVFRGREIVGTKSSFLYNEAYSPVTQSSSVMSAGTIDPLSYLCAIQYPAYFYDLNAFFKAFRKENRETKIASTDILEKNLDYCIKKLHDAGIYHLDIKEGNVGIIQDTGHAKFADWDFAAFQMYEESIDACYERSFQKSYALYYQDLCKPSFVPILIEGLAAFKKDDRARGLTKQEKSLCLEFIDQCCLKSLLLHFWLECGQAKFTEKKKEYTEFLREIIKDDEENTKPPKIVRLR